VLSANNIRTAGSEAPSEEGSSTATVEATMTDEVADLVEKILLDNSARSGSHSEGDNPVVGGQSG